MKLIAIAFSFLISFLGVCQQTTIFYDEIYNVGVPNVQLINATGEFIGLSNNSGKIEFEDTHYPLVTTHFGYESVSINTQRDTVFLTPKYQELDEVEIKPVNKMDLYNEILEHSSGIIDRTSGVVSGTYFESAMVVYKTDTVYLDNICDMAIAKEFNKKKYSYSIHCENGRRNYRNESTDMTDFDTSLMTTCLKFVRKFKDNFKYDLVSTKSFNLKFEENEIERNVEGELHRLTFENEAKDKSLVSAAYKGKKLYTWDNSQISSKQYDGKGLFVNYKRFNRYHEFGDDPNYFFNTIIVNGLVQIAVDGKFIEIYVVKGFIKNDAISVKLDVPVKNVEDYFEYIPYSEENTKFYTFEQK